MFAEQLTKTKMCRFAPLGKCTKGAACPFAHNRLELTVQPDLRCTKLCKELLQTGQCTNRKNCCYAHNKEELRTTDAFQKTKLCRNLQFGKCSRGNKCHFAHSVAELKAPSQRNGPQLPPGLGLEGIFGDKLCERQTSYDVETSYVSGEGSGSRDSGSDGDGASQHNRMLDVAYEPAYVRIGSDFTSFDHTPVSDSTPLRKRDPAEFTYLCGTDLDYLSSMPSMPGWQGEWGAQPMTSMHDFMDSFAAAGFEGFSGYDWNPLQDNVINEKKQQVKTASKMRAVGATKMID
jgi:hypothetical protein